MVAATVLVPERMLASGEEGLVGAAGQLPRSLRPARYVIEADSCLRAAVGPDADATTFPARTRQLTAAEVDGLWRQLRDSGLLDPASPARIEGPEPAAKAAGGSTRPTALVYASFGDYRTTARVVLDRGGTEALDAERIVDRLAALAGVK